MQRLALLDYGRFFAAIIVVLFHYTFNGIVDGMITSISYIPSLIEITKYGYLGVELFFMISGYVIFISAKNRSASRFLVSRAIRLYPAYWFAVLFTSFFALQWGSSLMFVSPTQIIINFSMLQSFLGVEHVDGVYWTLVYEISFYFMVSLLLFFGLQNALRTIFICWPILFCIAMVLGKDSLPYMGGYYYYFSAGALFAVLSEKFDFRVALSLLVSFALGVNFSAGNAVQLTESKGFEYSPVIIGLIVTSFFVLFICQNTNKVRSFKLPMSRLAGALTYPVYLIHAHFGYIFINHFATEENKVAVYVLTISIVLLVAFFMHKIIEVRLHSIWRALFENFPGRFVAYLQKFPTRMQVAYNNRIN